MQSHSCFIKMKKQEGEERSLFSRTYHTLVFLVAKRNLSAFSHVYSSLYGYAAEIIARSVIFRNGSSNRYLARINWNGGVPRPATTGKNFNFVSASEELFSPLCTYICLGGARVCEPACLRAPWSRGPTVNYDQISTWLDIQER